MPASSGKKGYARILGKLLVVFLQWERCPPPAKVSQIHYDGPIADGLDIMDGLALVGLHDNDVLVVDARIMWARGFIMGLRLTRRRHWVSLDIRNPLLAQV